MGIVPDVCSLQEYRRIGRYILIERPPRRSRAALAHKKTFTVYGRFDLRERERWPALLIKRIGHGKQVGRHAHYRSSFIGLTLLKILLRNLSKPGIIRKCTGDAIVVNPQDVRPVEPHFFTTRLFPAFFFVTTPTVIRRFFPGRV